MRAIRWMIAGAAYYVGGMAFRLADALIAPYVQPSRDIVPRIMAIVAQAASEDRSVQEYLDAGREANYGSWRDRVATRRPAND